MLPDGASVDAFSRDGFCLVRQLLDADEVRLLRQITVNDTAIHADGTRVEQFSYDGALPPRTVTQGDGEGGTTSFFVDDSLGEDFLSAVARCDRVAGTMEKLLGSGELYHWHHKMMLKHGVAGSNDGSPGGGFRWHQVWRETFSLLFCQNIRFPLHLGSLYLRLLVLPCRISAIGTIQAGSCFLTWDRA